MEVAKAVSRHVKVVEGLIGHLVKRGELMRLPGRLDRREGIGRRGRRLACAPRARSPSTSREFKEMFGLTRRLAIPLLEYLDGAKVTRRVGDRREVV